MLILSPVRACRLRSDGSLSPANDDTTTTAVREPHERLAHRTGDDAATQEVLRELRTLDIANLTPVQALIALNDWQMRLRDPQ